jgi:CRP-like cAMP-binding protein
VPILRPAITSNRLLATLPDKDRGRILAHCDQVELASGDILHEAGTPQRDIYFPTGAFFSLVTPMGGDGGLDVALVGNEGMVGISPLLGVSVSPLRHVVQGGGSALRISAASFRRELESSPALQRRLNLYVYVKMHQMAQTAACTYFHTVEPRLSRLLLMMHDRSPADEFYATHAYLAYMLSVRRVGITNAATLLQRLGLIRYSRGNITILDRRGLEAHSCGCYFAAEELYDRVLN